MDGVSEQILANLAKKEKEFTLQNEITGKVVIILCEIFCQLLV
jgi:hypothetical protein